MMNILTSRILSSSFCILISLLATGQSRAEYYYRYFDERIPLTCNMTEVALFENESSADPMLSPWRRE